MSNSCFQSLTDARRVLNTKAIRSLLQESQKVAREFRQKETELIDVLQRLDDSKAYRVTGYNSLYQYCVEALLLTEHQAYQYITVARKCQEVPELMVALEDRRITVSKARKLSSVITKQNQNQWIQAAEKSSQKELERAVRKQDPMACVVDRIQFINFDEAKLQATLTSEVAEKIHRVKELMIDSKKTSVKLNELFDEVCTAFLEKHDPVIKAKRAIERKSRVKYGVRRDKSGIQRLGENPVERKKLPAQIKHQVYLRDNGQCRFHNKGHRCQQRTLLEIHHRIPINEGGTDDLENLVLVCANHHKAIHS